MKELRVLTVCGMGFGTSLVLFMNIQDLGKKYGVNVTGEACDLGSYKGRPCDIIAAANEIATQIKEDNIPVVAIKKIIDAKEIEEKIKPFFEQ